MKSYKFNVNYVLSFITQVNLFYMNYFKPTTILNISKQNYFTLFFHG